MSCVYVRGDRLDGGEWLLGSRCSRAASHARSTGQTCDKVVEAAGPAVEGYDPESDPWDTSWSGVDEAGFVAGTVAQFLMLGWQIPDDLDLLWAWFAAGH